MSGPRRVVVIGAGFGGLAVCESLAKQDVEVVLVDRHNYNTFQPLLYQVATAGLNPGDIAYPVRAYAGSHPQLRFRQDEAKSVDFEARTVSFAEGPALSYDFLVLAVGASTNYFSVPGAEQHAKAIYTMEDALSVRDMALESVERASSHGAGEGDLDAVVVGGGADRCGDGRGAGRSAPDGVPHPLQRPRPLALPRRTRRAAGPSAGCLSSKARPLRPPRARAARGRCALQREREARCSRTESCSARAR